MLHQFNEVTILEAVEGNCNSESHIEEVILAQSSSPTWRLVRTTPRFFCHSCARGCRAQGIPRLRVLSRQIQALTLRLGP